MISFSDLADLKRILADFGAVKSVYDRASQASVADVITDGKQKNAFKAAMDMIKFAQEHHTVIELAVKELEDPKHAAEEVQRLLQHAQDHSSELGKFLDEARAIAGVEFGVITDAIAAHEAAKAK